MPVRTEVENPVFETVTLYSPTARLGAAYRPCPSDVTEVETLVPVFPIWIPALATAAPEASATAPEIVPVVTWAWSRFVTCMQAKRKMRNVRTHFALLDLKTRIKFVLLPLTDL